MAENPIFIKRKVDTKIQEYLKLPEILAIVGPRQSGKTTYLKHLLERELGHAQILLFPRPVFFEVIFYRHLFYARQELNLFLVGLKM